MLRQKRDSVNRTKNWTIIGTIFSVLGFNLWYFRVQKYLDLNLKEKIND